MYYPPLLQQFIIGLVVMTSTGTLIHDFRFGRALAMTPALSGLSAEVSSHLEGMSETSSAHTHVERATFAQDAASSARVQARNDHRKYYTPKSISRNSTPFGDSQLFTLT